MKKAGDPAIPLLRCCVRCQCCKGAWFISEHPKSAAERGKSANLGTAEAGSARLQAGTARVASNFVASHLAQAIKPYDFASWPDHVPAGGQAQVCGCRCAGVQPTLATISWGAQVGRCQSTDGANHRERPGVSRAPDKIQPVL